jgi:hypothetical protein
MSEFYVGSLSDENQYYFFGSTKGNVVFVNLFMFYNLKEIMIYIAKNIDDCPIKWISTYGQKIIICSKKSKLSILNFSPNSTHINLKEAIPIIK